MQSALHQAFLHNHLVHRSVIGSYDALSPVRQCILHELQVLAMCLFSWVQVAADHSPFLSPSVPVLFHAAYDSTNWLMIVLNREIIPLGR